jgi:hypothetical protein
MSLLKGTRFIFSRKYDKPDICLLFGRTSLKNIHVTSLLLERLERIPADSIWAHRASGLRGSLLAIVEQLQDGQPVEDPEIKWLIAYGFQILENAAREKT